MNTAGADSVAARVGSSSEQTTQDRLFTSLQYLNNVGVALSQERDINRLLETILVAAKNITHADGGTLYRLLDGQLKFEIVLNDSLSINMGGTSGNAIPFYPIPLYEENGDKNNSMVAAYSALNDETVNIADAYTADGFDFSGTKRRFQGPVRRLSSG